MPCYSRATFRFVETYASADNSHHCFWSYSRSSGDNNSIGVRGWTALGRALMHLKNLMKLGLGESREENLPRSISIPPTLSNTGLFILLNILLSKKIVFSGGLIVIQLIPIMSLLFTERCRMYSPKLIALCAGLRTCPAVEVLDLGK